jgi:hypothetical protein
MVCHISNTSQTPYLHYTKKNGEFGRNIKENGGTGQKLAIFSKQGWRVYSQLIDSLRGYLILPKSRFLHLLTERGFVMEPYRLGKSAKITQ